MRTRTWKLLAEACGGYSQVPDRMVGESIAGRVWSGVLTIDGAMTEIAATVESICDRWDDLEPPPDPRAVRAAIVDGFRDGLRDHPSQGEYLAVIDRVQS